jgi:Uma2 family endonuclease
VANVAWASDEFITRHGYSTPYIQAPELCVEVVSSSNTKSEIDYKISLFFAQGAQEVWIVNLQKKVTIYVGGLPSAKSKYLPKFKELP